MKVPVFGKCCMFFCELWHLSPVPVEEDMEKPVLLILFVFFK